MKLSKKTHQPRALLHRNGIFGDNEYNQARISVIEDVVSDDLVQEDEALPGSSNSNPAQVNINNNDVLTWFLAQLHCNDSKGKLRFVGIKYFLVFDRLFPRLLEESLPHPIVASSPGPTPSRSTHISYNLSMTV